MDGGEMWSRWDMQDYPPDVLITNYSMMNIMLMRSLEMPVFELTRQWLEADCPRVFHLVVDELHTYRGTPGTEVAYLIRVLLDRLGLSSDSDQLRIIASSASLSGDTSGLDYLEEFFGRDRSRFEIIGGNTVSPNPASVGALRTHACELHRLRRWKLRLRHFVLRSERRRPQPALRRSRFFTRASNIFRPPMDCGSPV
jgi:ATP-dependent helicase YprA (DUF1998 family)